MKYPAAEAESSHCTCSDQHNQAADPCDEPSGALDSRSTDELLGLFNAINDNGQTIVMVTHSVKAASTAKRVLFIKDGEVFHQLYRGNLTSDEMYQKITDTLTVLTTGGEHRE